MNSVDAPALCDRRFSQIKLLPEVPNRFLMLRAWDQRLNRRVLLVVPSLRVLTDPSLCALFLKSVRTVSKENGSRNIFDLVFNVYLILEESNAWDPKGRRQL